MHTIYITIHLTVKNDLLKFDCLLVKNDIFKLTMVKSNVRKFDYL